jgi:uncharacterized SAM-binding protein YcdF (DUF218 family)
MVRRRAGRRLAWAGLLGLFLASWPPMDWLFSFPLEGRYPAMPPQLPGNIQAIAVLGSSSDPPNHEHPYAVPDYNTLKRIEHAAWLYRKSGPLPVLACEGSNPHQSRAVMPDLLRRAGVPPEMIWLESRSRSTHENAVFGAAILHEHGIQRIALVVDGQSMPRAAACFRKANIDVFPAPMDLRSLGNWRDELFPSADALHRNEVTLHELVGTAWYWLRGWI